MKIKADSIDEFFVNADEYQDLIISLDQIIESTLPYKKRLYKTSSITMLGYGVINNEKYDNYPLISIAPQKNYVSVYVMAYKDKISLVETYKDKLGKVSSHVGCVNVKGLKDLNIDSFKSMLKDALLWNNSSK